MSRYRPSGSMLVALLALVMATTGSAVAASIITSKQIKDGTISTKDLSKKTVSALKGKIGPQGAQGAQGPKGDAGAAGTNGTNGTNGAKGDKGDPGPSNAKTNFRDASAALNNGFQFCIPFCIQFPGSTQVETVDVPAAGSYLVQAKVNLSRDS